MPVIAVTSKLLSTGVDVPTCRVIALDKIINSMTEFKQIIGRGSRVFEPKDKMWFTILDYRKATRLFKDEEWDGPPIAESEEEFEQITQEKEEGFLVDELGEFIKLKASRNFSTTFMTGFAIIMGLLILGISISLMFKLLLISVFIAFTVQNISEYYYSRKGI